MSNEEIIVVRETPPGVERQVEEIIIERGAGSGPQGPGRAISLDPHGTVSSGTEEISFNFTDHTLTATGATFTIELADSSESQPDTSLTLTNTETLTVTTSADVDFYGTNTLSALSPGDRQVVLWRSGTKLFFDAGENEILVDDELIGVLSGDTGIVTEVTLLSGSWAGNDAAGFIRLTTEDLFQNNEDLTSTRITPTVHAVADEVVSRFGLTVGVKQ